MRIVKVEPGKQPEVVEIEGTLKEMQQIVGGYIETVFVDLPGVPKSTYIIVCNEEGKLRGLPLNGINGNDCIAGTFFVCKAGEEDLEGLSDVEAADFTIIYEIPSYSRI